MTLPLRLTKLIHTSHSRLQSSRLLSGGPVRDLTASAPQAHRSRGITPARGAPLPDPAALTLRYRTASHHPDRPIRVSRSLPSTCIHHLVYTSPVPPTTTPSG